MATSNSSKDDAQKNQPADAASMQSVFLIQSKTSVGETSQLCRKVLVTQDGKQISCFQPLNQSEVMKLFKHPTRVNEVKAPTTTKAPIVPPTCGAGAPVNAASLLKAIPALIKSQADALKPSEGVAMKSSGVLKLTPILKVKSKMNTSSTSGAGTSTQLKNNPVFVVVSSTSATSQTYSSSPVSTKPCFSATNQTISVQAGQPNSSSLGKKVNVIWKVSGQSLIGQSLIGQPKSTIVTSQPIKGALPLANKMNANATPTLVKVNLPGATSEKTFKLRNLVGTNTYALDAIVMKTIGSSTIKDTHASKTILMSTGKPVGSVGAPKIPVGKVLPLQLSASQPYTLQKLSTPASTGQQNKPMLGAASSSGPLNNKDSEKATHGIHMFGEHVKQHGNSAATLSPGATNTETFEQVQKSFSPAIQPFQDPLLIPMKITAVRDTGDEVSVSRGSMEKSDTGDVIGSRDADKCNDEDTNDESLGTENCDKDNCDIGDSDQSRTGLKRESRVSVNNDVSTQARDGRDSEATKATANNNLRGDLSPNTGNDTEQERLVERKSRNLTESEEHISAPTLQNVYARVYLAPEESSSSQDEGSNLMTVSSENTPLKIDSVFSLSDDQKKTFFPEANNNVIFGAGADLETNNKAATIKVLVKQEPCDDQDDNRDNHNQIADTGFRIKEEPESPPDVRVKQEPGDNYEYSNYPIPNDDDTSDDDNDVDSHSDSTDTAVEDSPKKIKTEATDDDLETKNIADHKIRLTPSATSATSPQASCATPTTSSSPPDVKTPVVSSGPPPASASSWLSLFAKKKSRVGNTLILGGSHRSGKPLTNAIVTDAAGKKYIIVSPPEKRVVRIPSQSGVKGTGLVSTGKSIKGTGQVGSGKSIKGTRQVGTGKSFIVTMSNGQKRLIRLPENAPASLLLSSLVKDSPKAHVKSISGPKTMPKLGRQSTDCVSSQNQQLGQSGKTSGSKTVVIKSVSKSAAPSLSPVSQLEPTNDNRRRSAREKRNKRRYSPPPLGPARKRQYSCISPPLLEKESDKKNESSDTEHSSEVEKEQTSDGVAGKMDCEPAPLAPAVTSREERMRLLKDLIREKEAALEEMRKKREQEKSERENDPDLMDL